MALVNAEKLEKPVYCVTPSKE